MTKIRKKGKKIVWLVVSCLMVLSLVMASCGPAVVEEEEEVEEVAPGPEVPKYGGVEIHAWSTDMRGWDDAKVPHFWIRNVAPTNQRLMVNDWTRGPSGTGEFSFYTEYVRVDDKAGELCESWEIFPEGRIVFKIRQGIHYGLNPASEASRLVNGRELDAYDVEYSLNRLVTTPGSYHITSAPDMARDVKIKALDKWTLEFSLYPELFYEAIYMLCFQAYGDRPREVIEKYGDMSNWKNVVGTGAFLLTDYVQGSSATYVRNPNYW